MRGERGGVGHGGRGGSRSEGGVEVLEVGRAKEGGPTGRRAVIPVCECVCVCVCV